MGRQILDYPDLRDGQGGECLRERDMKNLRYILHGSPLQPDNFISEKKYFRQVTTIAVLPASVVGVVFVGGLIPVAGLMDMGRLIKLMHLRHQIRERRKSYARAVLLSLDAPV